MKGYLDILIYAIISGILFFWLFSILGKRNGEEKQPLFDFEDEDEDQPQAQIIDWPKANVTIDEATKEKVTQLKAVDPGFSEHVFLKGAKAAFEMIVSAFAEGNLESLKKLLAPDLFNNFKAAIDERVKLGHRQETRLESLKDIKISDAYYKAPYGYVTVRFQSEQLNIVFDKDGKAVEGDPDHYVMLEEDWTFKRDFKSQDPNWMLVTTREVS
jgi:predicted lipid-binding transport protein (Tim44 family)